jgi:hypothetical protein
MLSSMIAAIARIPATAFERGRELDLRADRIALDPATNVSPQSPSPATLSEPRKGEGRKYRSCRIWLSQAQL